MAQEDKKNKEEKSALPGFLKWVIGGWADNTKAYEDILKLKQQGDKNRAELEIALNKLESSNLAAAEAVQEIIELIRKSNP